MRIFMFIAFVLFMLLIIAHPWFVLLVIVGIVGLMMFPYEKFQKPWVYEPRLFKKDKK